MKKIYDIQEGLDHIVSELICLNCKQRYLDIRPIMLWLKDLECPKCKEKGFLIETGEIISNSTYQKICNENQQYKIYRKYEQIYQNEDE